MQRLLHVRTVTAANKSLCSLWVCDYKQSMIAVPPTRLLGTATQQASNAAEQSKGEEGTSGSHWLGPCKGSLASSLSAGKSLPKYKPEYSMMGSVVADPYHTAYA